jgi:hypothetical protein
MMPFVAVAQRTVTVNGTYTYIVGDNDDISLREAKVKCIELAKAEAIKAEFGEMITSDVIDTNLETNGEATSSFFWENTVAMAKGDWLGDTKSPELDIEYKDGKLVFKAEVWGKVREIVQAKTDLKWNIMKEILGQKSETTSFVSGERIFVRFRSPSDGYVAVYLIVGDDETSCLLPYRKDPSGMFKVRNGKEYIFFDKDEDPRASFYKLSTLHEKEANQLVVIYSPNPFAKCTDITGDARHPNSLSTHDFQKWLLKCQRADRDMVVAKKWVTIRKNNSEKEN